MDSNERRDRTAQFSQKVALVTGGGSGIKAYRETINRSKHAWEGELCIRSLEVGDQEQARRLILEG